MNDKSILQNLKDAPRVQLEGSEPVEQPVEPSSERYQIVGEIARGGVGIVYKGRDTDLGRDVAMKLLRDDYLEHPEILQRFIEEAQIGGQLQHPGIVPVYELGLRDGEHPYFAMKLVKGRTLAELLGERKDATENRRALLAHFAQVCQTVAYAHARGVIHRDLKPANVMIGGFGEVQVVDWGFAKVLRRGGIDDERRAKRDVTVVATVRTAADGSASVAGSVMGTPAYMPPEQALGHVDDLTERADVFALGAILCEILTGTPPYTENVMVAAAQASLDDAHGRLDESGAAPDLIALAKRCLSAMPKDRPRTAREVADVVTTYLAEAESRAHKARVRAAEEEARSEEQRRARRHTLVIAASVLAVVLLGGGAWLWTGKVDADRERERIGAYDAAALEATRLEGDRDWAGARTAADRAAGFVTGDAMREPEARALQARIDDQEQAAQKRADKEKRESALLAALDAVLLQWDVEFEDYRNVVPELDALADFDRNEELAAHLDAWASVARKAKNDDWRRIDAMARRLDDDPWRNRLRDARPKDDVAELRALADDPDTANQGPRSLFLLGVALADKDREAALKLLRPAWERFPDDFWINRALAKHTAQWMWQEGRGYGRYEGTDAEQLESIAYMEVALALRPSAAVHHSLGHLHLQRGNHRAAVPQFRAALRLDPDDKLSHQILGMALVGLMRLEEAEAACRDAVRRYPKDAGCRAELGMVQSERGHHDAAIATLKEAIDIDPEHVMP
ncbi:MAG: serine/threonine-protein kinase, partial [Planctomycetota bacterium]